MEIWFTPSFNIKTTDKKLEHMLRKVEFEVFDPWSLTVRKVKATKSIIDAYLVIEAFQAEVPEVGIKILQAPELPSHEDKGSKDYPVTH